jgi:AraC-like DNA-binding protein
MSIALDYAVPGAGAAEIFTLFYHFRADVPRFEDTERADHAQLRFRLSTGGATYHFADGSAQEAPAHHVVGPTSGAMRVVAEGPVHVFGAGITPAGWAAITGASASAFLNRVVDAHALLGCAVGEAAAALGRAADTADMVAIVEAMIDGWVADARRQSSFVAQVDAWLAASHSPQVDDLVTATGLSRRQVERRCNALYGAPPKLLARKYRALKAAVSLAAHEADTDALIERGFYDQSHFIREVKQFTGLTPVQLREQPNLLAQLTIAGRHALTGQINPIISET